jgi:hypothetical protein
MSDAEIRPDAERGAPAPRLPESLEQFIETTSWTFAKTYSKTWVPKLCKTGRLDHGPKMER